MHLAGITLVWGAAMIGMGFVDNFGQLAGMRVLLGILEAGFVPSCVYLLSTWYTRCRLPPKSPFLFFPFFPNRNKFLGVETLTLYDIR